MRSCESLKVEVMTKLNVRMMENGFSQVQRDLVASIFYTATANVTFTPASKEVIVSDTQTNDFWIKKFAAVKMLEGLSKTSIQQYTNILTRFGQHVSLLKATTDDVRVYLAQYRLRGASSITTDNARRFLCTFYKWLTSENVIQKNPMLKIKRIKAPKILKEPFTEVEMERLRAACADVRERALVETLLSTGCRASEVATAKLSRLNLGSGELRVIGKGSKERIVYLNASTKFWLQKYLAERKDNVDALFIRLRRGPGKQILPLGRSGLELLIRKLGEKAHVDNCHPHRFRRTAATWAARRGMPVEQVQQMLGNASLETTMIYTRVDQADVKRSHEKYLGG